MKPEMSHRHTSVLTTLSHLPKKMLSIHGTENVSEFVLHDLCDAGCFAIQKAAYFVDNPDFDTLKGIAGYNHENRYAHDDLHWHECDKFTHHMQDCAFNSNVRTIERSSHIRGKIDPEIIVEEIASQLHFQNPAFYRWGMKHDNSGLFIYEANNESQELDEHIKNGLHILGFCPIF